MQGGAVERVCVYLGASAPVSGIHTNLARALLDEGFDRVFIFLLRWSPARHGVSPDTAEAQLRKWLLLGVSEADMARIVLQVVEADQDAGPRMRASLGPGVDPEVQVCFSQKYAGQTERIERDWLPIYTKEFPKVLLCTALHCTALWPHCPGSRVLSDTGSRLTHSSHS